MNDSDLLTLVELQKFLADELAHTDGATSFSRAFTPLTDGLGLQSPASKEEPPPPPAPTTKRVDALFGSDPLPSKASIPLSAPKVTPAPTAPAPAAKPSLKPSEQRSLTAVIDGPVEKELLVQPDPAPARPVASATQRKTKKVSSEPPPVPTLPFIQRFMAGLLDEIFVLTMWCIALVVTANVLSGEPITFSTEILKQFASPAFVRFAALEFATIWLAYLAIGIGILDMTFGMWVWGIRVSYAVGTSDWRFLRKINRITLSFFFFAPIVPTVLLAFRRKGRNILDWLSSTGLTLA